MAKKALPCPTVLRQLLRYESETGKFFWRERGAEWFTDGRRSAQSNANAWNSRYANEEAFTSKCPAGYVQANILGKIYKAHRVAFAIHYGREPKDLIDHINRDRCDNRISNLREADSYENMWNLPTRGGASNKMGAHYNSRDKRWVSRITCRGKVIHLGGFETEDAAAAAYADASRRLHGEFSSS